jgi:hypothetical protein
MEETPVVRISIEETKTLIDRMYAEPEKHRALLDQISQCLADNPNDLAALDSTRELMSGSGVEVWVCSNEKNHKTIVEGLLHRKVMARSVPVQTMVVGDYWIVRGQEILVVIEGKKITDLRNSITDGRLADQVHRIIKSRVQRTMILVSGYVSSLMEYEDEKMVSSMLAHLQFADERLRVQFVNDDSAIIDTLASICRYAPGFADGVKWHGGHPCVDAVKKKCKKMSMDNHRDYWYGMLLLCSGMEGRQARAIAAKYSGADAYIADLKNYETDAERRALLADIKFTTKSGGVQRVGPVMSARYHDVLVSPGAPAIRKVEDPVSTKPPKKKREATDVAKPPRKRTTPTKKATASAAAAAAAEPFSINDY